MDLIETQNNKQRKKERRRWNQCLVILFVISGQPLTIVWTTAQPSFRSGSEESSTCTTLWSGDHWSNRGEALPQNKMSLKQQLQLLSTIQILFSHSFNGVLVNLISSDIFSSLFSLSSSQLLCRWAESKTLAWLSVHPCDEVKAGSAQSCQTTVDWLHTGEMGKQSQYLVNHITALSPAAFYVISLSLSLWTVTTYWQTARCYLTWWQRIWRLWRPCWNQKVFIPTSGVVLLLRYRHAKYCNSKRLTATTTYKNYCFHSYNTHTGLLQTNPRVHSHPEVEAAGLLCSSHGALHLPAGFEAQSQQGVGLLPPSPSVPLPLRRHHGFRFLCKASRSEIVFMSHH